MARAAAAAAAVVLLVLAPARPARAEQLDADQVLAIAAEAFGPAVAPFATRVARCESGYDTNARGGGVWVDGVYRRYDGLWQIDWSLHAWRIPVIYGEWRDPGDPRVQAAVAAHIAATDGWGAWPVCSRRAA